MASIWVSQPGTICTSKILFLLFSSLLIQRPDSGESSPISSPHQRHRPAPGLGDGHGGVVDPSLLEQDDNTDMQSLLESLKEQFLRTFNLSGLGPPPLPPGSAREEPPEYMMELYNRFANDRTAMPTANIIRSFKNEGTALHHMMMALLNTQIDSKRTAFSFEIIHSNVHISSSLAFWFDIENKLHFPLQLCFPATSRQLRGETNFKSA